MDIKERKWLDSLWKEVKPVSLKEAKELKGVWEKFAWMQAHDEGIGTENFQVPDSLQIRLLKTLIEGNGER